MQLQISAQATPTQPKELFATQKGYKWLQMNINFVFLHEIFLAIE
ncbi:hypothetical protein [Candidatus Methylobacter favarea]|nr:hypothetical protein [Candidatus Methylobacter favarea]